MLMQRALDIARGFVGVREKGSNAGREVEIFQRSAGIGKGEPWCAAFVYYCIYEAAKAMGYPDPFKDIKLKGYTVAYLEWARDNGMFVTGQHTPGSLFLLYYPKLGRVGHIGFIAGAPDDGYVPTIEGNTNAGGSRSGDGVYERRRSAKSFHRIFTYPPEMWKYTWRELDAYLVAKKDKKALELLHKTRSLLPLK